MILINITEWCVDALILSLAIFFFSLGTLVILMLLSVAKEAFIRIIQRGK
jgi:hypothetical protein|tara:strand:- start:2571 stop:2720 length:150 start_codon:yes stop_codon:yes gene_type:complete